MTDDETLFRGPCRIVTVSLPEEVASGLSCGCAGIGDAARRVAYGLIRVGEEAVTLAISEGRRAPRKGVRVSFRMPCAAHERIEEMAAANGGLVAHAYRGGLSAFLRGAGG